MQIVLLLFLLFAATYVFGDAYKSARAKGRPLFARAAALGLLATVLVSFWIVGLALGRYKNSTSWGASTQIHSGNSTTKSPSSILIMTPILPQRGSSGPLTMSRTRSPIIVLLLSIGHGGDQTVRRNPLAGIAVFQRYREVCVPERNGI
jgi:hypothetical protein